MNDNATGATATAEPMHVPARTPEETDELLGNKPKDDGSVPRTSVTVTIADKEYVFGDLPDRIARETITPIMTIQGMQANTPGGHIGAVNLMIDFLGRFHESTWDDRKNRSLYHQGVMHKDRKELNEANPLEVIKAFGDISEMLTDPFIRMGLLTRDPDAEAKQEALAKLISTSS